MNRMLLIKLPYWLGVGADALWALAMFFPALFAFLTGNPQFQLEIQVRTIMAMGGTLFTGWTILLIWAVREPVERRFVILLTAFVVFGLFIVALLGFLNGNTVNLWILVKTTVLFILMINSYILAGKTEVGKYE